ncbi:hypothetical protein RhiirB3_430954 [Rhizophagus irregularis]|nr:hypothetical protein RhiirB3_430954 [Rhizophagus irregularis]
MEASSSIDCNNPVAISPDYAISTSISPTPIRASKPSNRWTSAEIQILIKDKSASSRHLKNGQERVTKDFSLSKTEQNFLESIRKDAVCRKEAIMDIVLSYSATSFKVYTDEIKRLSWENSKLREELQRKNYMMDKIKNEQMREISQAAERMRLELKKNKWEEILEIPVLPEISNDDPKFKEARDIFFYDIPKYWSKEEVRTNLMKIGKHSKKETSEFVLANTSSDEREEKGRKKDDKKATLGNNNIITPQPQQEVPKMPATPLDRIYRELGNFTSRNYDFFADAKGTKGKAIIRRIKQA